MFEPVLILGRQSKSTNSAMVHLNLNKILFPFRKHLFSLLSTKCTPIHHPELL